MPCRAPPEVQYQAKPDRPRQEHWWWCWWWWWGHCCSLPFFFLPLLSFPRFGSPQAVMQGFATGDSAASHQQIAATGQIPWFFHPMLQEPYSHHSGLLWLKSYSYCLLSFLSFLTPPFAPPCPTAPEPCLLIANPGPALLPVTRQSSDPPSCSWMNSEVHRWLSTCSSPSLFHLTTMVKENPVGQ